MKQLLAIATAILLLAACSKDKPPTTPTPKIVLLKKTTVKEASGSIRKTVENFYNSNNAKTGWKEYLASTNQTSNFVCETNAAKQVTKIWETTGAYQYVLMNSYDASGRLSKQEAYSSSAVGVPSTLIAVTNYTYSTTGYESQSIDPTTGTRTDRNVVAYTADSKNISSEQIYRGTTLYQTFIYNNYDNKNNIYTANAAPLDVRYSRNNYSDHTLTYASSGATTNVTYTYDYDANNFPVTVTQKVNGAVSSTTEYEYIVK